MSGVSHGSRAAELATGATLLLALVAGSAANVTGEPGACDGDATAIRVSVQGVRSARGTLVAVLYGDDPSEFLQRGKRLARERVPVRVGTVDVCLPAARPGTYAVVVYHDENDNRQFDRRWNGLPAEGFGVSNNPRMLFGVPSHSDAAFRVGNTPATVAITLTYP